MTHRSSSMSQFPDSENGSETEILVETHEDVPADASDRQHVVALVRALAGWTAARAYDRGS